MKSTITKPTLSEPQAKLMHTILLAQEERLKSMRAGKEWQKRQGKR